jgi:hypothetical protein
LTKINVNLTFLFLLLQVWNYNTRCPHAYKFPTSLLKSVMLCTRVAQITQVDSKNYIIRKIFNFFKRYETCDSIDISDLIILTTGIIPSAQLFTPKFNDEHIWCRRVFGNFYALEIDVDSTSTRTLRLVKVHFVISKVRMMSGPTCSDQFCPRRGQIGRNRRRHDCSLNTHVLERHR